MGGAFFLCKISHGYLENESFKCFEDWIDWTENQHDDFKALKDYNEKDSEKQKKA